MLITVNFGTANTGASVYYTILNADKSVSQARTLTGVTELTASTGLYGVEVADALLLGKTVLWDIDGTAKVASDTLPITAAATSTLIGHYDASGNLIGSVEGSVGSIAGVTFPGNFGVFAIDASGNVRLITASVIAIAQAVWDFATTGLVTAGSVGKRLIEFVTTLVYTAPPSASDNASAAATAILVTPANKIPVDASGNVQTAATDLAPITAVTDQLGEMIADDASGNPQWTANALELGSASGGIDEAGVRDAMTAQGYTPSLAAALAVESEALGDDPVTVIVTDSAGAEVPQCPVYVSSDIGGLTRSMTRLTDSVGAVTFRLTDGDTYHLWPVNDRYDIDAPIAFVAVAD
ncbi:MAG: hypothetical protein U1E29_05555 [Coriobacteriia bacterium]|nr:hypothetical protein [Coriobacteriia bacterium]